MTETREQRVAIVTGASSGIGEAAAMALAQVNFAVVVVARREDRLQSLCDAVASDGGTAYAIAADLSDGGQTSAVVEQTLQRFGRVDLLVNNAGYGPPYALEQMDRAAFRHVFDVNLIAAMQLIAELVPHWRQRGGGRVINVSSMSAYVSAPLASSYGATKAGLEAMTDSMRLELKPWSIDLCTVIPGFVHTQAFDTAREQGQALRDDADNPYRELMISLDEFAQQQLKREGVSSAQVAKAVVDAALAKRLKRRYFVPFSARISVRLVGLLPGPLREKILSRLYHWGD